ncbi:sensor histidine kinase [Paenibacillus agricola]|uniref:Sensor histidine kinase n=1 Tax=Paenibacillus agricola TaxID=2716264 RepID=A0ABX0J9W7_9BACL|nr:sensor histidine kinase [Paenibacillus agricola]NHN32373.1 sensor histidine kinase [Paenibacillus agricola]
MWVRLLRSLRSFRFKLMIAALTCTLIPTLISLTIHNDLTRDAMKEQAVTNAQETLLLVDGYVTNLLKHMLYITNYVQNDIEMNTILKEVAAGKQYEGPDAEYRKFYDTTRVIEKLDTITGVGGEPAYVTIILPDGTYYANYSLHDYNPIHMLKEPWFGQLNNLYGYQSYWIGTTPTMFYNEQNRNPYQISVARTLRGEGLKIYGYVIVTIMENQVNQSFESLALGQEMMLLDTSNTILSHKDSARIGQPFPVTASAQEQQKSSDIVKVDNVDYLISQHPLSLTGWKLVTLIPYEQAIFKISSIFNRVLFFQLIAFILFMFILLYVLRAFTKPIMKLRKVVETVERGNLEVRSHIRRGDEIGYLGEAFDHMLERVKGMIAEVNQTQTRKRNAELAMLQAQINPHFLFNVLNSIRMKVMGKGDKESAEMISSLSKLLRLTISQDKGMIHFHEEMEIVMDYVKLMNMRQKEKVQLEVDVPKDAFMIQVPRFFLQPVIENALLHGLHQSAGSIRIQAQVLEERFVITIEDSGQGMDADTLQALRHNMTAGETKDEAETAEAGRKQGFSGIGLPNVYERMRMTFGDTFEMAVDSKPGACTRVTMDIPREVGESHV